MTKLQVEQISGCQESGMVKGNGGCDHKNRDLYGDG